MMKSEISVAVVFVYQFFNRKGYEDNKIFRKKLKDALKKCVGQIVYLISELVTVHYMW